MFESEVLGVVVMVVMRVAGPDCLARAEAAVDDLADACVGVLGGVVVELVPQIAVLRNRLDAIHVLLLNRVDLIDVKATNPNATLASWLREVERLDAPKASALVRTAEALRGLPCLAGAAVDGSIPMPTVIDIVRIGTSTPTCAKVLPEFEEIFVELARKEPAARVKHVMGMWADQVDPALTFAQEQTVDERRGVYLSLLGDHWVLNGTLTKVQGARLAAALNAIVTKNRASAMLTDAEQAGELVAASTPAKRADALVEMAEIAAAHAHLPTNGGQPATINITVPFDRLAGICTTPPATPPSPRQPGERESGERESGRGASGRGESGAGSLFEGEAILMRPSNGPGEHVISAELARELSCDCTVHRIVINPAGLPLDVGRSTRSIPHHIRIALNQRDKGCVFPSCDKPAQWCHAHHIQHWAQGGETSLTNLALLCSKHHHETHTHNHTIHNANGKPTVTINHTHRTTALRR